MLGKPKHGGKDEENLTHFFRHYLFPFFSPHFLPFLMSQEEQRKAHKRTFLFAFPWLYTTFGA